MKGASGRAPLPGNRNMSRGLRNGSSFLVGAPFGSSLLGIQKEIGRKAQRMDMSVHREL